MEECKRVSKMITSKQAKKRIIVSKRKQAVTWNSKNVY